MADPTVDLWAIDEVHFQQHGSRCRMWVPPETKDPVSRHHPTRHSVRYFGAVRLGDGRFQFRRETDKFNGLTFFEFMKGLYQTSITSGRRVVGSPTTPNTTMPGYIGSGGKNTPPSLYWTTCLPTARS